MTKDEVKSVPDLTRPAVTSRTTAPSRPPTTTGSAPAALGAEDQPARPETHGRRDEGCSKRLYTIHVERNRTAYEWRHTNTYRVIDGRITVLWWSPFEFETAKQALCG
jgi:hypothetical protein